MNMNENEAAELSKSIDAELEAYVINDEITAHVINDEITAHVINDEIEAHIINNKTTKPTILSQEEKNDLEQVAETFDVLEADGVDLPPMSPEDYKKQEQLQMVQKQMQLYYKSKGNHIPHKEFQFSDVTYVVQDRPHVGMWVRKEKKIVTNPNMLNHSVARKFKKNPTKYTINYF